MDPQTGDATEKLSRREIALSMCDELAALGLKPSLRLLRSKGLHGSDTDVQADVNYWYGKLLAQHTANSRADAIPTLLREQMLALWDAANTLAKEAFSEAETAIRSEAEDKILKAQEAANLAEQKTAEHKKLLASIALLPLESGAVAEIGAIPVFHGVTLVSPVDVFDTVLPPHQTGWTSADDAALKSLSPSFFRFRAFSGFNQRITEASQSKILVRILFLQSLGWKFFVTSK